MILVIGGMASGKRSFACKLGYGESDVSRDAADTHAVLLEAQELARDAACDVAALAQSIAETKQVVTFTEIGSGIVPIDADERTWRERAGALSRELASRAEAVVRMTCGIPEIIAGAICSLDASVTLQGESARQPHSFFSNRACKYFPCHEGIDERDFNCLFCYCPLYALGPECGGNFTYTKSGRKNCKNCSAPHRGDAGIKLVASHYEQLASLASLGKSAVGE